MEDKELKVMESRVRAAAEKCPTAKEIFKELWPEVFSRGRSFRVGDIVQTVSDAHYVEVGKYAKVIRIDTPQATMPYLIHSLEGGDFWCDESQLKLIYRN